MQCIHLFFFSFNKKIIYLKNFNLKLSHLNLIITFISTQLLGRLLRFL